MTAVRATESYALPLDLARRLTACAQKCDHAAAVISGEAGLHMDYIRFGSTGLKVSQLGLGTMSMGSSAWKGWVLDESDSIPLLRRALELGINFIDMADWYSTGRNEEVVARNLLTMAPREQLVLATKVFYPMSEDPND